MKLWVIYRFYLGLDRGGAGSVSLSGRSPEGAAAVRLKEVTSYWPCKASGGGTTCHSHSFCNAAKDGGGDGDSGSRWGNPGNTWRGLSRGGEIPEHVC